MNINEEFLCCACMLACLNADKQEKVMNCNVYNLMYVFLNTHERLVFQRQVHMAKQWWFLCFIKDVLVSGCVESNKVQIICYSTQVSALPEYLFL